MIHKIALKLVKHSSKISYMFDFSPLSGHVSLTFPALPIKTCNRNYVKIKKNLSMSKLESESGVQK